MPHPNGEQVIIQEGNGFGPPPSEFFGPTNPDLLQPGIGQHGGLVDENPFLDQLGGFIRESTTNLAEIVTAFRTDPNLAAETLAAQQQFQQQQAVQQQQFQQQQALVQQQIARQSAQQQAALRQQQLIQQQQFQQQQAAKKTDVASFFKKNAAPIAIGGAALLAGFYLMRK